MRAAFFRVSKMLCMESSTGRTKHAASWPMDFPAFIIAGEFGRNSEKTSGHRTALPVTGIFTIRFLHFGNGT
jgi:hypothetical protein